MLTSHSILLKFRHDPRYNFTGVGVWYEDRGVPGNLSKVSGDEILALEAYYFGIGAGGGEKRIPYHRIRRISFAGETVWER
jgi:uncharacterized protein (UPF0248 family)